MSTLMKVDRSVVPDPTKTLQDYGCPGYTQWMFPELQSTGPSEYTSEYLVIEFPKEEDFMSFSGNNFFESLEESGSFPSYLNLQDGEAFRKAGTEVFREFFGKGYHQTSWCVEAERRIILWKSARFLPSKDGYFRLGIALPCLRTKQGQVLIEWKQLETSDLNWGKCPFVRFSGARP